MKAVLAWTASVKLVVGAVARAAGQLVSGNDYSLHLGADAQWLIRAPRNQITGAQTPVELA